jgi:hypothetical protein
LVNTVFYMAKRPNSQNPIPAFRGSPYFKPAEADHRDGLPNQADDPAMPAEERGTIKRYLRYADTFLSAAADETPADNEPVREVSLLGTKRPGDKRAA